MASHRTDHQSRKAKQRNRSPDKQSVPLMKQNLPQMTFGGQNRIPVAMILPYYAQL